MAANRKQDEQENQEEGKQQSGKGRQSGGRSRNRAQRGDGENERQRSRGREGNQREEPRVLEPTEVFDPIAASRLATLRLARNWRFGGNTYGAMHAYERILAKYGGTPAAHAAAEELIAMAGELEREGKFYTALNIFNKVEEYYSPHHGDRYESRRPTHSQQRRNNRSR